jgi:hypothetical protein
MNTKDANFISMCGVVDDLMLRESVTVNTVPALVAGHTEHHSLIAREKAYQLIQSEKTKGITGKKGETKNGMIDLTMKIIHGTRAYAIKINDIILKENMNYSKSKLEDLDDESVDVICNLINTKASAVPVANLADYNLTAADFTAQSTAVGLYSITKELPSGKIDEKQVATDGIKKTLKALRNNLEIMDNLVKTMEADYPDFFDNYFKAREVYDIGVRHKKPDENPPVKPPDPPNS